jgi:integrating conjugative element membrane protein (TIGR03747 family)
MLQFELSQLTDYFKRSVVVEEPGRTTRDLIERTYDSLLVDSGALAWLKQQSARARSNKPGVRPVQSLLSQVYINLEAYALAAFYTLLTFLVRLMVLLLTVPLFFTAIFVGLVDGLVRRDIRRFGAGRESGFVYHRAKAAITPIVALPWVVYLALPVSVQPLWILIPSAILLGIAVDIAAGSFKKYL